MKALGEKRDEGRIEGADTLWPLDVQGETRWVSTVSMSGSSSAPGRASSSRCGR